MKDLEFKQEGVILANGTFPTHPYPVQILKEAPYVICCDGAADKYIEQGFIPDAIIGDGDSLSEENKKRFAPIFHQMSEQFTNDQTKAVNFLHSMGKTNITIVGATGKREDHTIGNIGLLIEYMRAGLNIRSVTNYGIFIPFHNTQTLASKPGQQISIFNFGAKGLKGEGLEYPLSDFPGWWQGTLNEATGTSITIHCTGDYLVFCAY
ncbi:MAG: thiamine diphosphokinase [Bacteroidaceae bacterium]|nr:thiamine diphosphokinase [Bacteroidaceae bacterium]